MNELVIIGGGGFGKEVLNLVMQIQAYSLDTLNFLGFIDSNPQRKTIHGYPVLGDDVWAIEHLNRSTQIVAAIGNSFIREKVVPKYEKAGFSFYTPIHPSVTISPYIHIGEGTIICEGCILTTDIHIGKFAILNLHTTVGHDTQIEDFVTISPGVNISGNVSIGKGSEIGTGAAILPGISLGNHCILGAGAVATKNLERNKTYIGVPAREMKREQGS